MNVRSLLLIAMFVSISNYYNAQIKDCVDCHNVVYRSVDIEKNTSVELERLRNEIFARKGYIFKDKNKRAYFKKFDWYVPTIKDENSIKLNEVEQGNVKLFLQRENKVKKYNKNAISELKSLKKALKQQNVERILSCLNGKLSIQSSSFESKVKRLKGILLEIDLNDVNWYRDQTINKTTVDNGKVVVEVALKINETGIWLSKKTLGLSSLMPIDPESEFENESKPLKVTEWKFSLKGSRLKLDSVNETL